MTKLNADRVRELLNYDAETGRFTWLKNRPRAKIGDEAGYLVDGRFKIGVDGTQHHAARLAFLWMTGTWPNGEIDHINRNPKDNRWSNLREATRHQNQQNRTVRDDSSTGFKGVRFQRSSHGNRCGYYVAQIGIGGKRKYLGSFKTAEEASEAYKNAATKYHGEFART